MAQKVWKQTLFFTFNKYTKENLLKTFGEKHVDKMLSGIFYRLASVSSFEKYIECEHYTIGILVRVSDQQVWQSDLEM